MFLHTLNLTFCFSSFYILNCFFFPKLFIFLLLFFFCFLYISVPLIPINIADYDRNSSDPILILGNLKHKNNHKSVMENLNINSTSNKFGNLKLIIQGKTDILVITETKTDSTFPLNQFVIHSKSYRFDRSKCRWCFYICLRRYFK